MKARISLLALALTSLSAYAQDTVKFEQVYVGFNGPSTPASFVFTSAEAASSSWLGAALVDQIQPILSKVDFKQQTLVVTAVGERETTTGKVSISRIEVYQSIVTPYVRVGVNDLPCTEQHQPSYPFVVAVIERPQGLRPVSGYDLQNFSDGCTPVPSGTPHNAK